MSARKQKAPDSMEQGESKVALPRRSRGLVGAVGVGPRAVAGGGRSSPTTPGQGPSCPQPAGPRLGSGHLLGPPCLQCPLPLQGLQPCPSASSAGAEQALGGNPSGTLPPAPQRCSFPVAFALSPPACLLCRRAEADPALCGDKLEKRGLCAHVFCLHCFVCGESGAAILCRETGCDRSFHLPCAVEGGCVTQFALQYRAFCWEHRPEQAVEAAPEENTTCLICLDLVEERKSYSTMVCPACKHAWFHRGCIQVGAVHLSPGQQALGSTRASLVPLTFLLLQGQALCAGISCFQCPLCRDKEHFLSDMLTMGIRIPFRLPSWENRHQYAELGERHSRCDARECLCPRGREQAEQEGPWQLLLCCSCAAEGTHRRCSDLRSSTDSWECDACAGLGTASSASSELAGPSTASQAGSGQSLRSPAPETSSPSTASQLPAGSSCGSPPSETSSPSTASQAASRSCGSPPLQGSSRSSPPGPVRMRDHSRLQRRAQHPYSRPGRCHDRSRAPAPSAESSTPSQAAPGPSHSSPAPETSSPSTASQLPAGSSSGSPPLETSSPSTGRQAAFRPPHGSPAPRTSSPGNGASGPSQGSPALEGSSRSSPPGPDRVRNSSRLQRRAQHPYSRPGRRHGTSRAPSPSAGPDPPPPAQ
ncbi:LOW QUALITY PROTEIN: uncharacterized protein LOC142042925 [Buteo buteo]|uniref:LOW QUALITY PROTEIN: uncharacterized protein LOC142042925 n=1 Tax=Buteo buteo TaxID=30397 RepID=UPI003EBC88E4